MPPPRSSYRAEVNVSGSEPAAELRISAIVFCDERERHLTTVLDALKLDSTDLPFELLLVRRRGSRPEIDLPALIRFGNPSILELPKVLSFAEAANRAVRACTGDLILVLDPVGLPDPGFVKAATRVFSTLQDCGAVGGMCIGRRGDLMEAGRIMWREGCLSGVGGLDSPLRPEYNYLRRVDSLAPEAQFLRRRAFERVGGYDEAYLTAGWALADLCLALRREGFSTWYQPSCILGGVPENEVDVPLSREGGALNDHIDRSRLRQKWLADLAVQSELDLTRMFGARDRNPGRTVLVFDQWVPAWNRDAGSRFMFEFLQSLALLQALLNFQWVVRGQCGLCWPDPARRVRGLPSQRSGWVSY